MKKLLKTVLILLLILRVQAQSSIILPEKPEVVFVRGGTFKMGSNSKEINEQPIHSVSVSSFSIGKYEVTEGQYKAFCNETGHPMPQKNPKWTWIDNTPILNVTYDDAISYCNWLSEKYGGNWRLPTEAEWEFAARGGNKSKNYEYSGSDNVEEVAWHVKNNNEKIQPIGTKKPNELGLFDMSGNVFEWCSDWYASDYYKKSATKNPKGATSGDFRVLRGGGWWGGPAYCRVSKRYSFYPNISQADFGFRVVLSQ